MKSKISFLNKGIFISDIKRFGWIGVVHTLVLFFFVPLQILMNYDSIKNFNEYNPITNIFYFRYEIHPILMVIVPTLTGIFLFLYIHSKKSVDLFHTLPLKRESLYNSHILVGKILIVLPIILTAFASWILNITLDLKDYYTIKDLINWTFITCLMEMVFFMFTVFVGMMTGISILQGILTYILLFLPAGLTVLIFQNLQSFVYGFVWNYQTKVYLLSPILRIIDLADTNGSMKIQEVIIYIILCIVLYFLAKFSYKRRNMERASEAIAFSYLIPIFKYGVTFCTMLVVGLYFWETQGSIPWTIFGYFFGSLGGYYISEIVLKKSLRVFSDIKGYALYMLVMIVVLLGTQLDITGYEKRIPPLENIESIYFSEGFYSYEEERRNFYFERENLKYIGELHQQIIKDKNKNQYSDSAKQNITFIYKMKDGKRITRGYTIDPKYYEKYLKPIYESNEYKKINHKILNVHSSDIQRIRINSHGNIQKRVVIIDPNEIDEATKILKKEIQDETYGEMTNKVEPWAEINILLTNDKEINDLWKKNYKGFEKWLEKKGYIKNVRILPEDIAYVIVEERKGNEKPFIDENQNVKRLEIRDKEKIEFCLRNYTSSWDGKEEGYIIGFYSSDKVDIIYGYFDKDHAPDYIRASFQ